MSTTTATRCPQCAAPVKDAEARHCMFCGSLLVRETPVPRNSSVAELLAEVERHPEISSWRAHVPSSIAAAARPTGQILSGLLLALFALGLLSFASGPAQAEGATPAVFRLFVMLFVALGAGLAIFGVFKIGSLSTAELERIPALIADKRTRVAGGGNDMRARTTYFATLERADGTRTEYEVHSARYAEIAQGDYGLAYLRGNVLLDFRRVGLR